MFVEEGLPGLTRDKVHIWPVPLDLPHFQLDALHRTLAPDEVSRAARFHFDSDARAYIAGRGLLRAILARYLGAAPGDVRFTYEPHGKPQLAPGNGVQFNLTHSRDRALIAVTRDRQIGVDLEWVRPLPDLDQLAMATLTPDERANLYSLAPKEALAAFFRAWTRKEAVLKARGDGLTLPPDQVEVALLPNEPAYLRRVAGLPHESARWTLRDLGADVAGMSGYAAALAVEGGLHVVSTLSIMQSGILLF